MAEIIVIAYLVLGLPIALLLWMVLKASARYDESQSTKSRSLKQHRRVASKTKPINVHVS